ncbi:MAG: glucose-1-phosphate cytidylyltransferase [Alphaproteobacteria bacterium]|nr:glucose-1-phosphate cytidylyltransferase [Alphaproteobacteria bacterium]
MKVVILAGGLGTRLGEETSVKPKPMVEIGGYPIIWHIMNIYAHYGFNDFIILGGYKHEVIKDYFANYSLRHCDMTVDLSTGERTVLENRAEPWRVTMLYTGKDTMTGGRIRYARPYINDTFMLTYGDGVSDVDIPALIDFHKKSGKFATLTAVQPEGRFGIVEAAPDGTVTNFQEKPKNENSWINGGFFVCEPQVFDYIPNEDSAIWEKSPLQNLSRDGKLGMYKHRGFWRPMDMLKDKQELNKMWDAGNAPWKIWNNTQGR